MNFAKIASVTDPIELGICGSFENLIVGAVFLHTISAKNYMARVSVFVLTVAPKEVAAITAPAAKVVVAILVDSIGEFGKISISIG